MKMWKITGYDGTDEIMSTHVPQYQLSNKQVQQLLKILVSKYSLSDNEIINSCLNRRSKSRCDLLNIQRLSLRPEFTCGENPFFTAVIVEGEE